ncbi:hypothetical protein DR950_33745 [Kitasatospora xanthocidica]|uniref:Uncharacterized protein n=1 Tax=Kitasatospora xanthocidica TaxID=83382 RepID=A0A373A345_9ACTN|nr:hypothetical protein [Kitasatospora xanthocidica]RGD62050.1 hypothetical protein DR950_33745 [Kitasatospora xanthocidica]
MKPPATVWAKVELPGFHYWPAAPDHRSYLRARHRHLFHITVGVAVAHDDRDTEFHDLGDLIRGWWGPGARECGPASCETLARTLADHVRSAGLRATMVAVSEDGEAGAVVHLGDSGEQL